MNKLIKINYETEQPTVSARELHKALEVSSRFSRWFDTNKEMFVEGEDYNKCTSSTVVNNGAVRELEDYEITVLMAKHLSMMSRTEKGSQIVKSVTNNYTGETTNYEKVESAMLRALNKANKKPITLNNRELRRGLRDGGIVLA